MFPHMKESLFYEITRNITGGGKKQCARSGVDYIKVNFHTNNFELIDKVIDVVALHPPLTRLHDLNCSYKGQLCLPFFCSACIRGG